MSRGKQRNDMYQPGSPVPKYQERVYSPPYEIVVKQVVDQKKRNLEQRDRVENSLMSMHVCEQVVLDLIAEAQEKSEFMQNVLRQEPDYIINGLIAFAGAYLDMVVSYDPLFDEDKNTIDRENYNLDEDEPDPGAIDTYVSQSCKPMMVGIPPHAPINTLQMKPPSSRGTMKRQKSVAPTDERSTSSAGRRFRNRRNLNESSPKAGKKGQQTAGVVALDSLTREFAEPVEQDESQRKELMDKVEQELRTRLGQEKRFQTMMEKHQKEDQIKYKKLAMNVSGLKEFTFDSYGNPITMREKKPQPTDVEVVKPEFKMSKKAVSNTINQYYASAYEKAAKNQSAALPPPAPKLNFADSLSSLGPQDNQAQKVAAPVHQFPILKNKKKKMTLLEEHMTDTQRARSQSNLPQMQDGPVIMIGCVQLQLGKTYYGNQQSSSKKGDNNSQNSINMTSSSMRPPIFDNGTAGREVKGNGLNRIPSFSTLQNHPTFTFAEDTVDSKQGKLPRIVNSSQNESSIKENSSQKPPIIGSKAMKISQSNTKLETNQTPQNTKKVFVKKELTHLVQVKNARAALQSLQTNEEMQISQGHHHPTVNFAKITVLPASSLSTKHSNYGSLTRESVDGLLPPPDSRNQNPFSLRKYQTSLNSDTASMMMRKTSSTILSPNEKIIEMKPWLARGQINKTEIGQELYKKQSTNGSATKMEKINVE